MQQEQLWKNTFKIDETRFHVLSFERSVLIECNIADTEKWPQLKPGST